ncbi:MipA/OmpV family protein [Cupriavidus basilensis]|uniref:MipA/OmpV family protein n=1 Tax=Cupriavidus basilensis TaxID=68895 RepID=A0ABT6AT91_9BURK|nr:MipA/OmpV family protein [Cupriavidus basilensis]MDF3835850.1 MipA/OmpV family protein [Cupriavidus basilensis]
MLGKSLWASAVFTGCIGCAGARAENVYTLGLGAGVAPLYEGSNEYHPIFAPLFSAEFSNGIFISPLRGGLGYGHKFSNGMFASLALDYDEGRSDRKRLDMPGSDYLKGMGRIPGSFMGAFQVGMPIYGDATLSVTLDVPLTHRQRGLSGHIDLEVPIFASGRHQVTFSPSLHFGSRRYTQTFFGVTDAQAASSAFRPYATKAGFDRASLSLAWTYEISRTWSVNSVLGVSRLLGDSANSPIVQSKQSYFGLTSLNYSF